MARHNVIIQERADTGDSYGGSTVVWSTMTGGDVWAAIRPASGRESVQNEGKRSTVTTKMVIRYNSTLKSTAVAGKYRVSYDGRYFPVLYIKNLAEDMEQEGTAFQELACEENAQEN